MICKCKMVKQKRNANPRETTASSLLKPSIAVAATMEQLSLAHNLWRRRFHAPGRFQMWTGKQLVDKSYSCNKEVFWLLFLTFYLNQSG